MPHQINTELIRDRLPVKYRFNPAFRIFMLIVSSVTAFYSLYFLIAIVDATAPTVFKILPVVILFVAVDALLKHTTSLNQLVFDHNAMLLKFILRPTIRIPYPEITELSFRKPFSVNLYITYNDAKGQKRVFRTNGSFPKLPEIMLNIFELAPNVTIDETLKGALTVLRTRDQKEQDQ
ncbi:MAG: hypothetical protein CVU48_08865 [Candidatus Cloacimonetes bacterium HGW-Cloacimonetes-1]|jgi:hypothetical protein|nr:MAG: hypothetical protein CVU48_08865 [Candidatus Cloacimonetes bacterium HGW-Cloacimonetes-1]